MKFFHLLVICLLPISSFAAAAPSLEEPPLLLHAYDEGLVPEYMHHRSSCAVFADRLLITRNYNGVETKEVRPIRISPDALIRLNDLIQQASLGPVKETAAPTDGPYDGYTATFNPQAPTIILKQSQSSSVKVNESKAARGLVLFIDAHCPDIRR